MGLPNPSELIIFILLGSALTPLILFFILTIIGLIRVRKPDSEWLIIIGFSGFAFSSFLTFYAGYNAIRTDLAYENIFIPQREIIWSILPWILFLLPVLSFITLFIIGILKNDFFKTNWVKTIGCSGTILAFVLIAAFGVYLRWPTGQYSVIVKSDTHGLQIALERYASDHDGYYPENIYELYNGYVWSFPTNVYSLGLMINVEYGSEDVAGNFSYYPIIIDDKAVGYYLLAYGSRDFSGSMLMGDEKPDQVILVLQNTEDNPVWPPDTPFPDVKDVILSSQY